MKTGCTGDEVPYKGEPLDSTYALPKDSAAWRDFRLEAFGLFVTLFQGNPDQPRIELLFG